MAAAEEEDEKVVEVGVVVVEVEVVGRVEGVVVGAYTRPLFLNFSAFCRVGVHSGVG